MSQPSGNGHALTTTRAQGWNTWDTRSVLNHVLMPEGLSLRLSFCHHGMLTMIEDTAFGPKSVGATAGVKLADSEIAARRVRVRPGPHALDGGYTALTVEMGDALVSVESVRVGERDLVLLVKTKYSGPKPPSMAVEGAFLWNKPGHFIMSAPRVIGARAEGFDMDIYCTEIPATDGFLARRFPSWVLGLAGDVGISTSRDRGMAEIAALVNAAREQEAAGRARFGAAAERYAGARACLAWNTVYEPLYKRVITTPSRQWNVDRLGYGIFCWDSFFLGWLLALDDAELAWSCVREVFREMVDGEFVPNVVNGSGRSSLDRSQPCIGGLGVLALHELRPNGKYLREVWGPLLAWNRWWDKARKNRLGLLSPGSHPFEPRVGDLAEVLQPNTLRGAKLEGGPDNAPMWDDIPFDSTTHLMALADVGLNALYILDCEALARLARGLGLEAGARELDARGAAYRDALGRLWNEDAGIFQNVRTDTGEFNPRTSPTCFYPLLTGAVTGRQADAMLERHLLNEAEYWGGWVIPSVPRSDPAYPEQHYWRGRIWAPLNFLVYLGLKRAGRHEAAAELARRSTELYERNWRESGGLFENFSAVTGRGGDVELCDPMCPWTGLLVLMELFENKTVPLPSLFI
jgi:hypothetical protein